jgi:glucan 1,3-beta-glucosidase
VHFQILIQGRKVMRNHYLQPMPLVQQNWSTPESEKSTNATMRDSTAMPDATNETHRQEPPPPEYNYIRGVNLGGWLVLERYIAPYNFAITTCHTNGNFCWYPQQLSRSSTSGGRSWLEKRYPYHLCTPSWLVENDCQPILTATTNIIGQLHDYPMDEYTLGQTFRNHGVDDQFGNDWLEFHFDNFVTKDDIRTIVDAGVTHVRVPLPHWIFEKRSDEELNNSIPRTGPPLDPIETRPGREPYLDGNRWYYFTRLIKWIREIHAEDGRRPLLQVWPDLHTAPGGSQNGFDNRYVPRVETPL